MYVLGIDLGTGSLKGVLVNRAGQVIDTQSSDYPLHTPLPGYSEQDPALWVTALDNVIKKLSDTVPDFLENLEGISFSGQMHSLVLLDEQNNVIRNAILWNDVRTTKQCETISKKCPSIVDVTKNIPLEGFTLPKILWVQENEPDNFAKVKHILLPASYLNFYLTGTYIMDYSDAAGTLMLDVLNKKWSDEIISTFGIDKTMLPALATSTDQTGVLSPTLKEKYGFKKEVQIFTGAADNAAAAVGAGIVKKGVAWASIGTSGVFGTFEEKHSGYNGSVHYFNHSLEDTFYSMGVTLAAGDSLTWFKETFAPSESFNDLLEGIEKIESNLFFTPYISGERTPYPDSKIRGSFIGIDRSHTLKHFAKAVLEGITFSLKDCQRIMEGAGQSFASVVSIGGGAKNKAWLQMQADIFNAEVVTLVTEQGPGLGAAMFAAVGVGWFSDLKIAADVYVSYDKKYLPNPEKVAYYKDVYNIYTTIYNQTKSICHHIHLGGNK